MTSLKFISCHKPPLFKVSEMLSKYSHEKSYLKQSQEQKYEVMFISHVKQGVCIVVHAKPVAPMWLPSCNT